MAWKGFKDIHLTIEIDLTRTEEDLWNDLDKDARYCFRKTKDLNFTFKEETDWEKFYPLYQQTIKDGGADSSSIEYLKNTKNHKLLILREKGKIIGGMGIKVFGDEARLFLSSINSEYLKKYAGYFAYWNLILWSKGEGFKILDLGGYQINPDEKLSKINLFKKKWGGQIVRKDIYFKNPIRLLGRKMIRNSKFFWDMNKKLKGRG